MAAAFHGSGCGCVGEALLAGSPAGEDGPLGVRWYTTALVLLCCVYWAKYYSSAVWDICACRGQG